MILHSQRIIALFLTLLLLATTALAEVGAANTRPKARPEAQDGAQTQAEPKAESSEQATDQSATQTSAAPPQEEPDGTPRSTSKEGVVFASDDVSPPHPLSLAMSAAEAGDWEQADALARRLGPAARTLMTYIKFRNGVGTPREMLEFTRTHKDWPRLDKVLIKTELAMVDAGPEEALAFFKQYPAQSGLGALVHARALQETGQTDTMKEVLIHAWRTMDLTTEEHDAFIADHAALLSPYHAQRLDMALWRGLKDVQQMLPLVNEKTRKRAEARLAIKNKTRTLDEILSELNDADKADPGIAYEIFNWKIENKLSDEALNLLIQQSKIKGGLGQPEDWAGWRRSFARSKMRDGDAKTAYQLAATHQLTEGSNYADLEWLSGYLALTYLDAPAVAYVHFDNLKNAVQTPISLGRAGYWIGRALEASNLPEDAQAAYKEGAKYQSSFYGLLAAEKAGVPFDLWPDTKPAPKKDQAFESGELLQAIKIAYDAGQGELGYSLLMGLIDSLPEPQLRRLEQIVAQEHSPFLEVKMGKRAAKKGIVLSHSYYPMHPLANMDLPVSMELALSIARRESEFNPTVRSHAGAEGLMQLMPGTASDVARDLGLTHSRQKVLSDWSYNVRLGSTYLAQLARQFDGNIVMISAGYNAGPGRPVRWMEDFGDPRKKGGPDIVDWIEHIPFRETRNYVMRVSESLPIYRAKLGKTPLPVPFSKELAGASIKLADAKKTSGQ